MKVIRRLYLDFDVSALERSSELVQHAISKSVVKPIL